MKNRFIISLIHKYGVYYSIGLFIVLLLYIEIYPIAINFWLMIMCFGLNGYFIFHKGTVFGLSKQGDFAEFQRELIKQIAKKRMQEINKNKKDNRLN